MSFRNLSRSVLVRVEHFLWGKSILKTTRGGAVCSHHHKAPHQCRILIPVRNSKVLVTPCALQACKPSAQFRRQDNKFLRKFGGHQCLHLVKNKTTKKKLMLSNDVIRYYSSDPAGQKLRANVPPKGPCWRHRVCHLGAIVVAWAARWRRGVGRI